MTELEAVNILLGVIGEAPVDAFGAPSDTTESLTARRTLSEVSRDVQSEGWSWNTDRNVKLARTGNEFIVTSTQLRVTFDPTIYPAAQLTMRGNKVYDRDRQTTIFTDSQLTVSQLVVQLVWDDMPHQAQQYMAIRAARIFAGRFVNSNAIFAYTLEDEQYARNMLIRLEESGPLNNWLSDKEGLSISPFSPADGLYGRG